MIASLCNLASQLTPPTPLLRKLPSHRIRREPSLAFRSSFPQPDHTILDSRRNMQPIAPPHSALMKASTVPTPTSPSLLAEPVSAASVGVGHAQFIDIGVEDDCM